MTGKFMTYKDLLEAVSSIKAKLRASKDLAEDAKKEVISFGI